MLELEIYAPGLSETERVLQLDQALSGMPGMRFKVDSYHDIVYLEFEEPTVSLEEIREIFFSLGLEPRFVGAIPSSLKAKNKTQRIALPETDAPSA